MNVNIVLVVGFVAFIVFALAVEAYCVAKGLPTISERIQRMGRSAPLVAVIASCLVGMLLMHFFG